MADAVYEKGAKKGEDTNIVPESPRGEVQLDKNGFELKPQPVVGDPLDPLNWTGAQKHVMLAIVMALCVHFSPNLPFLSGPLGLAYMITAFATSSNRSTC